MIVKKATFNFIEISPLNVPKFKDEEKYIKLNNVVDENVYQQTLHSIKTASKLKAEVNKDGDNPEFDLEAEIKNHSDSLYIKCFAIKADEMNDNGDWFGCEELKKATPTFVGVPLFTNHNNSDIEEARGKVVHAWWDEEKNGIMIIARVDAVAYPKLARSIKENIIVGTSMGASRGHDEVSMADGSKKRVDALQIGDQVYTHTGKVEPITAICKTQEHSKLYHIKWSGNPTGLALSYEHPVLILNREDIYFTKRSEKQYRRSIEEINNEVEPRFVVASEVKYNDYVLEWIDKSVMNDTDIDEDMAFLLGVYAAEGYCRDNFVEFCFGSNDKNIDKTREILKDKFEGKIVDIDRTEDRNGFYLRIYDKLCVDKCLTYIGTGSKTKRLHPRLKKWNYDLQKIFLGAYLDGDGCLVKERTLKSGHSSGVGAMQVSSASLQLMKDIRQLCLRIGCPAIIRSHYRVASKSTVMDPTTEYIEHSLCINNVISDKLKKHSYKAASSPIIKRSKFDSFFYKDYIAHKIKEVVVIDNSEPTYYVQVGDNDDENSDHSYILNDIATHNCQVAYSLCSVCHNYASVPDQYCSHIRERKTRKFSGKSKCIYKKNGEGECPICKEADKSLVHDDILVCEYNYGIKFIENSLVVNPACHDCGVTEVIDPQSFLQKVAYISERLPRLLKAYSSSNLICDDKKCVKVAGQDELNKLNQALDLMTQVSESMLKQRAQLDLEFLEDLIESLSKLQQLTDELTQQGYGRLQSVSPEGAEVPLSGGEQPVMEPVPSQITTGPAGVGTVTSPMAKKKIDLTKLSSFLRKNRKMLNLGRENFLSFRKKNIKF